MIQNSLWQARGIFLTLAGAAVMGLPGIIRADETAATTTDKSSYNLFNATPSDQLRPMTLDANDGVTDPTTVDAGYVQVQGDLVDYYHYDTTDENPFSGPVKFNNDEFEWSPRLSLGVLNNVEVFVHPTFYTDSRQYSYLFGYKRTVDSSGFAGINIGTKINLWGNDSGTTAFAVAPYVSIPNGGTVTGGADFAFAVRLPNGFYLKFVSDPYAFDHGSDSFYFGTENSMSLHKTFAGKFDAYAYLNTDWESDGTPWTGYSGFGLAYQFAGNLELFAGIGFGITSSSWDYNPRLGLGWRF